MSNSQQRGSGQKAQPTRRQYLRVGGTLTGALVAGLGVPTAVGASPETVVDLGEKGLREGEAIDDYLTEYLEDGVEVRIPDGTYDWNGEGFEGSNRDAAVVGDSDVQLTNTAGYYYQTIAAESGTLRLQNLTFNGEATGEGARFRLEADADASVVVDNVNFPDGSEAGAKAKAFYVPREHAGVVEIRNSYVAGFDDNGIYANSPGYDDGAGGQVIVEHCVARNNNISGIRIGSDESVVRHCLVLNDDQAPASREGIHNQRGIRVRSDGEDILIEDCEIIHAAETTGSPIQLHSEAEGGSGTITNVRIRNETSSTAIADQDGNTAATWEGEDISISGEADLDHPSNFDVETGSGTTEPTGEDPQLRGAADRWL